MEKKEEDVVWGWMYAGGLCGAALVGEWGRGRVCGRVWEGGGKGCLCVCVYVGLCGAALVGVCVEGGGLCVCVCVCVV